MEAAAGRAGAERCVDDVVSKLTELNADAMVRMAPKPDYYRGMGIKELDQHSAALADAAERTGCTKHLAAHGACINREALRCYGRLVMRDG